MAGSKKKYERQFKDDAVRIVQESGNPVAQVARDIGVNEGTLRRRTQCLEGCRAQARRQRPGCRVGLVCLADGERRQHQCRARRPSRRSSQAPGCRLP